MANAAQEASHFFLSMWIRQRWQVLDWHNGRRHDDLAGCDKQLSVPAIRG